MTGVGPTSQHAHSPEDDAPAPAAQSRPSSGRTRMNAANILRSMLPLVVICLVIVGLDDVPAERRRGPDPRGRPLDDRRTWPRPGRATRCVVPQELDEDYRPTSARTDAGAAEEGDPVTLEIGYLTPAEEFAGFVVSDDRRADPLAAVLDGAEEQGTVDVGGRVWTRSTTENGRDRAVPGGRRGDRRGHRLGVGRGAGDRRRGRGALLRLTAGRHRRERRMCGERHDMVTVWCVARRRAGLTGLFRPTSHASHSRSLQEPPCPLVFSAPAATTGPRQRRFVCLRDGDPGALATATGPPRAARAAGGARHARALPLRRPG